MPVEFVRWLSGEGQLEPASALFGPKIGRGRIWRAHSDGCEMALNYETTTLPDFVIELRWHDVSGLRLVAFGLWNSLWEAFDADRPPWAAEPKCRSGVRVYRSDGSYVYGWGFDYRSAATFRFGRLERMAQDLDPVEFEKRLRTDF